MKLNSRSSLPALVAPTLAITAVLALLALIMLHAAPAQAVIPEGNLLVNPGAENGPGAAGTETVPPPGWTTSSNFTVVAYESDGSGTFPNTADSAATGGGANFFAGGTDNDVATARQRVDVSASAPEIDAGGVKATVKGLLGGYLSQGDNGTITAAYVKGNGATQGSTVAGPVTPENRGGTTRLLPRSTTGTVPPGTRSIVVTLTAKRTEGFYNDGYFDNVGLTLGAGPVATRPVITGLAFSSTRLRAAESGPSIATAIGTGVSYKLSKAASVRFRVERALRGRRVGGQCVKPTQANRKAKACRRYRLMPGDFTHKGKAGANKFRFSGRLAGRKLRPGPYGLRADATDAAGNKSVPRRARFLIVLK